VSNFDTTTVEIPIDDIVLGNKIKNIRTIFDRARIEELADGIQRDGLMVPLIIMENEDDEGETVIELIAGERRLRAIKTIRNREPDFMDSGIPCIQFEGKVHDAQFVNASENIDRENLDEVDISQWLHSRVQDGVTQSELADRLHRSAQWVSFRVTFHERACDEVKQALREGLISFTAAYELSKNLSAEDQAKWIEKARRLNEKISLESARNAGSKDKSPCPGKRDRSKMLSKAEQVSDQAGSDVARGMAISLRWVDGLISDDEIEEVLTFEGSK
jgi:ParB/RepB/Spo0J family partition protein